MTKQKKYKFTTKIINGVKIYFHKDNSPEPKGTWEHIKERTDKIFKYGENVEHPLDKTIIDTTNPKDLIGIKKPPLSYIPGSALVHLSMAMKNGADKYTAYNWRDKKVQSMIYIDAAMRHLIAYLDGEDIAEDSGVHHLAHMMACGAILLDAIETDNLKDNRPKPGKTAEILKRFTS